MKVELAVGVAYNGVTLKLWDEGQAWAREYGGRVLISAAERNLIVLTPSAELGLHTCDAGRLPLCGLQNLSHRTLCRDFLSSEVHGSRDVR